MVKKVYGSSIIRRERYYIDSCLNKCIIVERKINEVTCFEMEDAKTEGYFFFQLVIYIQYT
jgi:hypothetical protein